MSASVEPGVQRILDITGLVPVLPVLHQREEAIQARTTKGASMTGRPEVLLTMPAQPGGRGRRAAGPGRDGGRLDFEATRCWPT